MKKVEHYICEICGAEYKDKNTCTECEKKHRKPVSIENARHIPIKNNKKGYPIAITIKMDNGEMVTYKR